MKNTVQRYGVFANLQAHDGKKNVKITLFMFLE